MNSIIKVFLIFIIFCFALSLNASETMDTALQLSRGQFRASLYNSSIEAKPSFDIVSENSSLQLGNQVFASSGRTESKLQCTSIGKQAVLKIVLNPFGGFNWWGKVGSGEYSLEIPSGNDTDRLDTTSNGLICGLGLKYQVLPETIVTYGICLDIGITQSEYNFTRFSSSSTTGILDDRFETTELQASLIVSRKFGSFEPYGGFKVNRNYIKLMDNTTLNYVDGHKENINLFVGSRIKAYPMEWAILEANFIGETSLSLGLGVGF